MPNTKPEAVVLARIRAAYRVRACAAAACTGAMGASRLTESALETSSDRHREWFLISLVYPFVKKLEPLLLPTRIRSCR